MATPNFTAEQNSGEEVTSIKFDFISHLPVHIVEQIFFYLSAADLYSATFCCLSWRVAVSNDNFWKRLCKRDDFFEVEERYRSEFYTDFLKRHQHWQGVYWYYYTLQHNWETNNYTLYTREIMEYDFHIRWFFSDDIFAYHSVDSAILQVYDLKLKKLEPIILTMRMNPDFDPRLDGPEFIKSGKYLIHFICNTSLTVWNLDDGSTVYDQSCGFTIIHVDKTLILLETRKEEFQVRNIETGQIEYEYKGITSVIMMNGRIVFTTTDDFIHIIKWADKSKVTLECCKRTNDSKLLIKDDFLLCFCERSRYVNTLCVWDIKTMAKLHSIDLGSSYYVDSACFMNKYLYIEKRRNPDDASLEHLIELWDYTKGTPVSTVNSLYSSSRLSNDKFMIASNSNKIGLWCFRKRDFISDLGLGLNSVRFIQDVVLSKTKIVSVQHTHPLFIHLYIRDYEM